MPLSYIKQAGLRARAYLVDLVHDRARSGELRLPTIVEMARACNVSKATLSSALRACERDGLVRVVPRGGVFVERIPMGLAPVTPARPLVAAPQPLSPRWQEIADDLRKQITRGDLPAGHRLPSTKELCSRYGAATRTVRRALEHLIQSEKARRHGRHFLALGSAQRRSTGTVVLIASRGFIENRRHDAGRAGALLRILEHEATEFNVTCLLVPYETFKQTRGKIMRDKNLFASRTVLGYLVQMSTLPHEPLDQFFELLHQTGRPVAVVDETGYRSREMTVPRRSGVRMFGLATGVRAGRDVGNILGSLGHRRVVFLSPSPRDGWSSNRLVGLREALGQDGVVACTSGRYWFDLAVTDRRLQSTSPEEQQMRDAIRQKLVYLGLTYPLDYLLPRPENYPVFAPFMRHVLAPALDAARAVPDVTCWVTVNDVTAFAAIDYLREHGMRIPADTSLASFDNSYEAFSEGITSYDFGLRPMTRAVLDYCVHRVLPPGSSPGQLVEVTGGVTPRQSTHPAGDVRTTYYPIERLEV